MSGSRRRFTLFAAITAISLAATACSSSAGADGSGGGAPRSGGHLAFALSSDPTCVDPQQVANNDAIYPARQLVDSLTDQDPKTGKVVPWLAKSWEVSKDATTFTFHLRDDATFSDGTPVDAQSVKDNFDGIVRLGAKAVLGTSYLAGYQGTTVVDRHTAKVRFKAPNAQFLQATSTFTLGLLAKSTVKLPATKRCTDNLIGSGPFELVDYTPNKSVEERRRAGYRWGSSLWHKKGPAYLEQLSFKVVPESGVRTGSLQSDQADAIGGVAPQDEDGLKGTGFTLLSRANPGLPFALTVNAGRPITKELAVRRAIQLGVNRKEVVNTVLSSRYKPATSALAGTTTAYRDLGARLRFDPAKAGKLLDEAGWRPGPGGVRVKDGKKLSLKVVWGTNFGPNRDRARADPAAAEENRRTAHLEGRVHRGLRRRPAEGRLRLLLGQHDPRGPGHPAHRLLEQAAQPLPPRRPRPRRGAGQGGGGRRSHQARRTRRPRAGDRAGQGLSGAGVRADHRARTVPEGPRPELRGLLPAAVPRHLALLTGPSRRITITMTRYLAHRLLQAVFVLWAAFTASFVVLYLLPGDPVLDHGAAGGADTNDISQEQLAEVKRAYGFDKPLIVQYGTRLWGALHGDFGDLRAERGSGRSSDRRPAARHPPDSPAAGLLLATVFGAGVALAATYTRRRRLRQVLLSLPALARVRPAVLGRAGAGAAVLVPVGAAAGRRQRGRRQPRTAGDHPGPADRRRSWPRCWPRACGRPSPSRTSTRRGPRARAGGGSTCGTPLRNAALPPLTLAGCWSATCWPGRCRRDGLLARRHRADHRRGGDHPGHPGGAGPRRVRRGGVRPRQPGGGPGVSAARPAHPTARTASAVAR